jgi:endonuclease V-like protein UPF0215 family
MSYLAPILFFGVLLGGLLAYRISTRKRKPVVVVIPDPPTPEALEEAIEAQHKKITKRHAMYLVRNMNRRQRRAYHAARRSGADEDQAIRSIRGR